VEDAAELVVSFDLVDLGWRAVGGGREGVACLRGAVWPVIVVLASNSCSTTTACLRLRIRMWSGSSRRTVPIKRSTIEFARGARTGVLMILMSMAVKTVSKGGGELLSRSRMGNRTCWWAPSRSVSRLRTSWVSQAPVG
jgi:hypothetical protein